MGYHNILKEAILGVIKESHGQARRSPQLFGSQRTYSILGTEWSRLPEINAQALQVLDPDDPDFGKFYYMQDYDPLDE